MVLAAFHPPLHERKLLMPRRVFKNLMMEENGSFQVRAEGSTRGRVELRPRAGAVPKPFENTP
jgi:hypothetical protein